MTWIGLEDGWASAVDMAGKGDGEREERIWWGRGEGSERRRQAVCVVRAVAASASLVRVTVEADEGAGLQQPTASLFYSKRLELTSSVQGDVCASLRWQEEREGRSLKTRHVERGSAAGAAQRLPDGPGRTSGILPFGLQSFR